ncbi:MFS transporter [Nonomuraea sp. NN258]|uniref:MFS transporter n=1 Tax=Nonomuraea antri TaxID=2730852 RepID=UPI00156955D1|nr:MFS transporter [Nonomuraea antri]NRQ35167.1 MFS transporter [Nonomuraea antri]
MTGAGVARLPLIMASVMLAILIGPLNSTMIAVALPAVSHDLHLPYGGENALVTVYLIAMSCLLPIAGKLGDRYGRRQTILAGLALFFLASLGGTIAGNLPLLVAFRALQAAGGALLLPNGMALLRDVVPPERLGKTLGLVGVSAPLAAAAGPTLGSMLLGLTGWRGVFGVNLVLLLVPVAAGWLILPRGAPRRAVGGFDALGSLLLCGVLVTFTELLGLPGSGLAVAGWAVAFAVTLTLFLIRVHRHPDPVVAPRLFRSPGFTAASIGTLLSNVVMYGALLALPSLMAQRWAPTTTGAVLSAMLAAVALLTPLGGWLVDRFEPRLMATAGFVVAGASLAPICFAGAALTPLQLSLCLAACGIGLGLANPALQLVSIRAVDPAETGMAGGVGATARYLGSITCSALLAGPLAAAVHQGGFGPPFLTFTAAALLGTAAMALTYRRTRMEPEPAHVRSGGSNEVRDSG